MKEALAWWFAISLIGAAAFPLAFALFDRLPDRGYAFTKVVGLLLVSYALWMGATIGLFPNSRGSIVLLLILMAALSLAVASRYRQPLGDFLRGGWRYILFVEAFFALTFAAAALLRSYAPEIQWGEKPFELAFLNALHRNEMFPPQDPWLSGHSISYYYFGYLMMAALTKLTGLATGVTFYLSLSLVASLAATAVFGVVYNLIASSRLRAEPLLKAAPQLLPRAVGFGLAGAGLLLLVSNLEGVFELMARHGVGSNGFYGKLGVYGLDGPYDCQALPSDCSEWYPTRFWWWWKATRIGSPWDIQEFPFFSFHFGDLHPHVIGLPFVITAGGLALNFLRSRDDDDDAVSGTGSGSPSSGGRLDATWPLRHPWRLLFTALFIGGLGFLNLWDLPTFFLLVVTAVFVARWLQRRRLDFGAVGETAAFALPLGALAVLLYVPFYLTFDTGTNGIALVEAAEGVRPAVPVESVVTRPLHLLLFWAPLFWFALAFVASRLLHRERPRLEAPHLLAGVLPWLGPIALWLLLMLYSRGFGGLGEELDARGANILTVALLAAAVAAAAFAFVHELARDGPDEDHRRSYLFALLAVGVGLLLILGPELFFIDDINRFRPNTVFKLWFQAWMFLSVGGAFGLYHLTRDWRLEMPWHRLRWAPVAAPALALAVAYAVSIQVLEPLRDRWWTAALPALAAASVLAVYLGATATAGAGRLLGLGRLAWAGLSAVVLGAALVYTVTATMDRTGGFTHEQHLDGLAFVRAGRPGEYEAVRWLNRNVSGTPVLLEAVDGHYSEGGRISSRSGLPTVLGWPEHETLWRGSDAPHAGREDAVRIIYQTQDIAEAQRLLDQFDVRYVYIGWLERTKYDASGINPQAFDKFAGFLEPVFQNDEVTIYRVPESEPAAGPAADRPGVSRP